MHCWANSLAQNLLFALIGHPLMPVPVGATAGVPIAMIIKAPAGATFGAR